MTTAITIENVSKKYLIGHKRREQFDTLRDTLSASLRGVGQRLLHPLSPNPEQVSVEEFWALQDVELELRQGARLGIIGHNGAGKTTLLKILSRITEPTTGRFTIQGRVSSLLEVGTGFHPELTGRENIFLNGAILGMTKSDIRLRYDEIVAFADVEKFLDTPVKRYSSGMYVRLAFAVAAHLEPDVLIIDEVLAVGDAQFQKKCLGKMQDVSDAGRTVLFVSHNMGMIASLCDEAILLDRGRLAAHGEVTDVINRYYTHGESMNSSAHFTATSGRMGDELAALVDASLVNSRGELTQGFDIREPVRVRMRYEVHQKVPAPPYANFHFFDAQGEYAFVSSGSEFVDSNGTEPGIYQAECEVPANLLNSGTYFIGVALTFTYSGVHVSFFERNALCLTVVEPFDEDTEERRFNYTGAIPGVVRPQLNWQIRKQR